jgi:hypothetical protein
MSATPIPAVPAPWIITRWSRIRLPVVLAAANAAASTTAAVPCMSSLNVHTSDAYLFRMRRTFPAPKSSQCNMACGNSLLAAVT